MNPTTQNAKLNKGYIALARKWRPQTFAQLIGQEHVTKALSNSLQKNRLHHAYLFTGTRGVGKTSIARIFAKALSCQQGIAAEPCLKCSSCIAIEQGNFIDLIEIDGASRTRVEDTRELLDNVQYLPTIGRLKIYLIDEVHMLSQHSFNALLKTLEEPPEHVKFFLATTDPQKLPITVLSRCLQFNLKPVAEEIISSHLLKILQEEEIHSQQLDLDPATKSREVGSNTQEAIKLIAKAAKGSIRDALSILDQSMALSDGKLLVQNVKDLLGYSKEDYAIQILQALANKNPGQLLEISKQITANGAYYHYVLDELINYLHQISIIQQVGDKVIEVLSELINLSKLFSPEDVQLFYQIGIKSREELYLAPTITIGFEMMLLRLYAFMPASKISDSQQFDLDPANKSRDVGFGGARVDFGGAREVNASELCNEAQNLHPATNPPHPATNPLRPATCSRDPDPSAKTEGWTGVIAQLNLTGLALTAVEHAEFVQKSENQITLRINKGHNSLFTDSIIKRIEEALSNYYKEKIKIILNNEGASESPIQQRQKDQLKMQEKASSDLQNDVFFQQLQETFTAELVENSIVSKEDSI